LYLYQENKGPAAARNLGIKSAQGDNILFVGDDIIADELLLSEHLKEHQKYNQSIAVLGYITWHPDIKPTPFMKFLEQGVQFNYPAIEDKDIVPYGFFFTANLSLKKEFLIKNGLFDEDFKYPAFEDIELAYRLKEKGMVLRYCPQARGYHYHPIQLKEYCQRQEIAGRSAVLFAKKHPEQMRTVIPVNLSMQICIMAAKSFFARIIIPLAETMGNQWLSNKCYGTFLTYHKLQGMKKELSRKNE
jgi:GT2 family glycosyltransferase